VGFTVGAIPSRSEAFARGARMLRTALGPSIAGYLEDPSIVEVMLNPDGRLWIDRLAGGLEDTSCRVSPADAERIVRLVAHHVGVEVHAGNPRVSAELPESGERFEGLVPPVVAAPCRTTYSASNSPRWRAHSAATRLPADSWRRAPQAGGGAQSDPRGRQDHPLLRDDCPQAAGAGCQTSPATVNGLAGLVIREPDSSLDTVAFEMRDGRIAAICITRN
jgi:hypothetical protein